MAHLKVFGNLFFEYARLRATQPQSDAEDMLNAVYRAVLQREPTPYEHDECLAQIQTGRLHMFNLAGRLMASREFQQRFGTTPPAALAPLSPQVAQAYQQVVAACPHPDISHDIFIKTAYQTLLQRDPDPAAYEAALKGLRAGTLSRRDLISSLVHSPEYTQWKVGNEAAQEVSAQATQSAAEIYQRVLLASAEDVPDEVFLKHAYAVTLQRAADLTGSKYFLRLLERNAITRQEVIESIMASAEYQFCIGNLISPIGALHQMRMLLFQEHLPPARRILDLGGAAHNHEEGSLLAMGYPHQPEEITIIDLPPEARIGGTEAAETQREIVVDGVRIRYLYRSMADLADIPAASMDLIVSGESIEHISEADGEIVCREAFRILAPGGSFCLDTPNGALTRIQSPDEFIHPEHQKEYLVQEIRDMLVRYGFEIVNEKGVCPMPESLRTKVFDLSEMSKKMSLSDNPEEGYVFFIHAMKPQA